MEQEATPITSEVIRVIASRVVSSSQAAASAALISPTARSCRRVCSSSRRVCSSSLEPGSALIVLHRSGAQLVFTTIPRRVVTSRFFTSPSPFLKIASFAQSRRFSKRISRYFLIAASSVRVPLTRCCMKLPKR